MIEIDGSHGEGGGQVLRTSLTLSAITGQALRINRVRKNRRHPGLAPQHLTCVRALAAITSAEVKGDELDSTTVVFEPQSRPKAGDYDFDVADVAKNGSAGSITLLFQALFPVLAFADGTSTLTLRGGTHVTWSPPFDYIDEVYLPMLEATGLKADVSLDEWGFYPIGKGQIKAEISSFSRDGDGDDAAHVDTVQYKSRGSLEHVEGQAVACNLDADIAERMANRARNILEQQGVSTFIKPERVSGKSQGAGIFLTAVYEDARAGFSALGKPGKPSEEVAGEACEELVLFHNSKTPVDRHLADQLMLPLALADGQSLITTPMVTPHAQTNAHIIQQLVDAEIELSGPTTRPGQIGIEGVGV